MKISLADLKKAIKTIEETSNAVLVNVIIIDNMSISYADKHSVQVEITLHADAQMLPKIKKEDFL